MTNNKPSNWFDQLIKNIIKLFSSLSKQGSRQKIEQKVQETKVTITEVDQDLSPPFEIDESEAESLSLESPSSESADLFEEDRAKVSRETEMQFRSETHTRSKEFRIPILQALVNLSGSAKRKLVFEELERIMGDQLTENDWNTLPSNKKMARWKRIATNARTKMLEDGLITVDPKMGIWMITEKGREELGEMRNKAS